MPLESLGGGCYRWGTKGKKYCGAGAKHKALMQGYVENKGDESKFKMELSKSNIRILPHEVTRVELENRYDYVAAYIPKKERDKIPLADFADPTNRKYPIIDQAHLDSAVRLIGRAPKDKQAAIKARIKKIAKRKGLKLPESYS